MTLVYGGRGGEALMFGIVFGMTNAEQRRCPSEDGGPVYL